jgi:hypothetical protein
MVICFGDVLSNFIYIFYASPVHTEDVDDSDENCDPLWDSGALMCLHVNKCRSDMTSFFYDQVHNLLPTAGQNIWNHRIFCSRFFVGACEPSYVRCQVGTIPLLSYNRQPKQMPESPDFLFLRSAMTNVVL